MLHPQMATFKTREEVLAKVLLMLEQQVMCMCVV